jgi:hypothetical protein
MKLLLSILLSFSAAALDAVCAWWALRGSSSAVPVLTAIGTHAFVCALAAAALLLDAPPSATRARGWFFVFCYALAFFVPVAGPIGLQLVVRYGLAAKPRSADDPSAGARRRRQSGVSRPSSR